MVQPPILTIQLIDVRRRAMRHGAWFRVLGKTEQAIINLTIRCVEMIKSPKLAEVLTGILDKLTENMKSQVERLMEALGCCLAQKNQPDSPRMGQQNRQTMGKRPELHTILSHHLNEYALPPPKVMPTTD